MEDLGLEVLVLISENLRVKDLLSLAHASKQLNSAVTPIIYCQANKLPRTPDLERITPLPTLAQSRLTELHLIDCNPFALGFCLIQWQKSANDFLCSFNSLRHLRVIDSFSTLPLLAPGILHQTETLRLINVSCGEHVASKLTRLGPGATDFAATLEDLGEKWTSQGSLTFNLDRPFYNGFGDRIEAALRRFTMLEYLGIVTPVVRDTEQQLDLCTGMTRIRALAPRIRSPMLEMLKIEMGKNLRHEKLPPYGWARALQRNQTWEVRYSGANLGVWETDQANLDSQLTKAIGQPYDPPADLRIREIWSKYMRQTWAIQTRFSKTDDPIPNWCRVA